MEITNEFKVRAGNGKRKFEEEIITDGWVKRLKRYESSQLEQCMKQLEENLRDEIVSAINKQECEEDIIKVATKTILEMTEYLNAQS